ncbi:MAG: hypothetical protein KJ755_00930, partial [Alphaproteobacteria bacterium]|nr:hypothetical protein [Alphaproteobacteria bacterium]
MVVKMAIRHGETAQKGNGAQRFRQKVLDDLHDPHFPYFSIPLRLRPSASFFELSGTGPVSMREATKPDLLEEYKEARPMSVTGLPFDDFRTLLRDLPGPSTAALVAA